MTSLDTHKYASSSSRNSLHKSKEKIEFKLTQFSKLYGKTCRIDGRSLHTLRAIALTDYKTMLGVHSRRRNYALTRKMKCKLGESLIWA